MVTVDDDVEDVVSDEDEDVAEMRRRNFDVPDAMRRGGYAHQFWLSRLRQVRESEAKGSVSSEFVIGS